jgi:hypothetical protein
LWERKPREKRAFASYHECASVWVRQTQSEGRSHQGRMYFEGRAIYSYRGNWPLAHIFYAPGDVAYVLVNTERYGVTTSRHLGEVQSAVASYFGSRHTVFETVRDVIAHWDGTRGARSLVYTDYEARAKEALKLAATARSRKQEHVGVARHYVDEGNRLATIFGDALPFPSTPEETLGAILSEHEVLNLQLNAQIARMAIIAKNRVQRFANALNQPELDLEAA